MKEDDLFAHWNLVSVDLTVDPFRHWHALWLHNTKCRKDALNRLLVSGLGLKPCAAQKHAVERWRSCYTSSKLHALLTSHDTLLETLQKEVNLHFNYTMSC